MATTVTNNPFDTQQSAGSGTGLVGGAMGNSTSGQSASSPSPAPSPMTQAAQFTAQQREVNRQTETAAGQVESLLAKDNPLMQRARTLAMQNMNQRGLVNSSMAQGAGVAAMIAGVAQVVEITLLM